jgi:hypothetical protein
VWAFVLVGLCDKGLVFCLQEYVGDIEANETLELLIFWVYKRNVVETREGVDVIRSCKSNFVELWHNDLAT